MSQQILFIHGGHTHDSYEEYLVYLRETEASLEKLRRRGIGQNLAERLGEGFEVIVPNMPCKQNAKYLEWKIWFEKFIPFLRDGIILIGHSLGGLFLVKYLSENNMTVSVRATLLIAAPFGSTTRRPDGLGDFTLGDDLSRCTSQAGKVIIYHSHDDEVVPFTSAQKYLESIPQAHLETFEDRGHFNQETFPELEETVKKLAILRLTGAQPSLAVASYGWRRPGIASSYCLVAFQRLPARAPQSHRVFQRSRQTS